MKAITTYFHASDLFAIAERAADAKNSDADGPIVAIIFCVIALEAFINESGDLATAIPTAKQQEIIEGYAQVMTELKDRREGLLLKYHPALLVFKGSTLNDHNVLLQDFKLLIALRNEITHLKADRWERKVSGDDQGRTRTLDEYPKLIRSLHNKGILSAPSDSTAWLGQVNTKEVAFWACSVARKVTHNFLDAVPKGYFKDMLKEYVF